MKITFNITYDTVWGEVLCIGGNIAALGNDNDDRAVTMRYEGNHCWSLTLELPDTQESFTYHYMVKTYGEVSRREWGGSKNCVLNTVSHTYILYDQWQFEPVDKSFFSSAFKNAIFKRHESETTQPNYSSMLTLQVGGPRVRSNQVLAITGNADILGNWDIERALRLDDSGFPCWRINLDASQLTIPLKYKFIILSRDTNELLAWESDENRYVDIERPAQGECVVIGDLRVHNPLPEWRGAGVAIPLFSLRSERSFGIGDFIDLERFVGWAQRTRQQVVQILPINDTTITGKWTDSYPYNANSIYALHPIYLNLDSLGIIADDEQRIAYEQLREQLNALPEIDYERVGEAKLAYTRAIFAQNGMKTLQSSGFKEFMQNNGAWLKPYAAFRYLTGLYKTADFSQWGRYATYSPMMLNEICSPSAVSYKEVAFHYYVQYQLHQQLTHVRNVARASGVVLKGDIPIGISRFSVDAWTDYKLFNMNSQAGAPPDDFSVTGQNWGFPTYNWAEMAKDGYSWWQKRFKNMAQYFDAYRIDHILGFFRIWEIPEHSVQGLLGHFNPAKPLSVDAINRYGYIFDEQRFTKPYIREIFLEKIFGTYTAEVKELYLTPTGYGRYVLQPPFDTQRKVQRHFDQMDDEKSVVIRDGLYSLINEVLFIEDPVQKRCFHPRISAQSSYSYQYLTEYEKGCFDTLYNQFFYEQHNQFWKEQALEKLNPLISSTDMLVCGEDLGMIPQTVPEVMQNKQILSLEIERMPKEMYRAFANLSAYPYLSVCTTSTHDMSTLRGWWEEDRALTQRYYNEQLQIEGEAPLYCEPWVCERIINNHLHSPAMLVVLPLQDWLSIDGNLRRNNPHEERINVPANPRNYWRYRMHITIEQLLEQHDFNNHLLAMVDGSGR